MSAIDNLTTGVTANKDAEQATLALVQNILTELNAAGVDPVKLQALKDKHKSQPHVLAAAVVDNTSYAKK